MLCQSLNIHLQLASDISNDGWANLLFALPCRESGFPSFPESQWKKDEKEMDGHLRGTSRGPVGVAGISGTCHHMAPGQEASGPAPGPPRLVLRLDPEKKRPHLTTCKGPPWELPTMRLYRLARRSNCHYPHTKRTLHISKTAIGWMKQRGMVGRDGGRRWWRQGKWRRERLKEISDFPPTVHFK